MLHYLCELSHVYFIHFGFWVTAGFAATLYKNGLMQPKELPGLFKSAMILSATLSVFSASSHAHYLAHFMGH
jgi:hypothetical protein